MKKVAFAAFALLALTSVAFADKKSDPDLKIQLDTPPGWTWEDKGAKHIMDDPKNEVEIWLISSEAGNVQAATEDAMKQLSAIMPDLKMTQKPQPNKINGMDATHAKLEGSFNEGGKQTAAKVALLVIKTPSGKFLIVTGTLKAATQAAHQNEVQNFIKSIKPL